MPAKPTPAAPTPETNGSHQSLSRAQRLTLGFRGHLLALAAGVMVTGSLSPIDLWPLGVVSIALLVWLLADTTPAQAAKRGWFYGLGLFGTGTSWIYVSIHTYGYAPVPLAGFLTLLWSMGLALLLAITAYVYVRWIRDYPGGPSLGFTAVFVLGEWLRTWLLTGFPWLFLGYAHVETPLAGWAPVGGIFAVSFAVVYSGAALGHCLTERKWLPMPLALVVAIWAFGAGLRTIDWVQPRTEETIKVAMVQANISQHVKWSRDQYWPTLNLYNNSSRPLWSEVDLVIWPEAAVPGYYHNAKVFLERMGKQAKAHNATLITGLPYLNQQEQEQDSPRRIHNSIMAFGNGEGIYHKQRLVPFGEYVPLENWLRGLIQFFDLPMSAFSPGGPDQQPLRAGNLTLAPFICYEVVYPELVTTWFPQADMLLTISNDAWFGGSLGPLQHLQMVQMRALESGRYVLRSTGSGVSAIIDQRGHITARSDQFKQQILRGEATPYTGATPFALTGSWPILLLCGLLSCSGWLLKKLTKKAT